MIDVPVSLIGTFAFMAILGFSLNNLTLFGLVLAIGIVVDDAIVVLENIERLMATGLDARAATIKAMAEVTGPIIAITLVLISVFLPAAFLPGISGQFYRQFALTIAASMVISAINAMTLTPSRAVAIFKTEQGHHGGHEMQREALPWWIFAIIGGLISVWLCKPFVAPRMGLPLEEDTAINVPAWLSYAVFGVSFLPGMLLGGLAGWFIVHPVNAVLSRLFRGFNWVFDRITTVYGRTMASAVRVSVIVLLVYGGLLVLTYWTMTTAPTGFIPMQDQGYLLVNVQMPDSSSVQRTQEVMARLQRIALGDETKKYHGPKPAAGEKATKASPAWPIRSSIAGQSFLLECQRLEFRLVLRRSRAVPRSQGDSTSDTMRWWPRNSASCYQQEIEDAVVTVFRARRSRGWATRAASSSRSNSAASSIWRSCSRRRTSSSPRRDKDKRLVGMFTLYRARRRNSTWTSTGPSANRSGWTFRKCSTPCRSTWAATYVNLFNKFGRTWQVNILADPQFRTKASLFSS